MTYFLQCMKACEEIVIIRSPSDISGTCTFCPPRAKRENSFLASPLTSSGFLEIFGVPWLVETSSQSLLSSLHDVLPVCITCVQISPFNKDISHMGPGPTPTTSA